MLEVGIKAPAFELPDQNGVVHTLEEFKGKNYVRRFSGVESYETIIKNGGDLR